MFSVESPFNTNTAFERIPFHLLNDSENSDLFYEGNRDFFPNILSNYPNDKAFSGEAGRKAAVAM